MYKYYYNLYIKSFILFYKERYSLIGTVDLTYNRFDFFLSYYLINRYLITFFVSIEYTFFLITNRNCILLFNLYYRYKPFIKSAKLLNDYIWFYLKLESNRKSSISFIYKKIKKWQYKNLNFYNIFYKYYFFRYKYRNIPVLLFKNKFKFNTIFFRSFYSLYGIRILCSGTFYKGRRKLRKFYHLWVADVSLTGKMPLNSMKFNIDFYKSSIPLKHASLGLKVWLLLCN